MLLFITELGNTAREKCFIFSTNVCAVYEIALAQKMGGLSDFPTDHPLIKMTLEGAKHSLFELFMPKEPLPLILVHDNALRFSFYNVLEVIQFFVQLACELIMSRFFTRKCET